MQQIDIGWWIIKDDGCAWKSSIRDFKEDKKNIFIPIVDVLPSVENDSPSIWPLEPELPAVVGTIKLIVTEVITAEVLSNDIEDGNAKTGGPTKNADSNASEVELGWISSLALVPIDTSMPSTALAEKTINYEKLENIKAKATANHR